MSGAVAWLLLITLALGAAKKVQVCDVFLTGAREGIEMAKGILPTLIAMLVAIGAFRTSGLMDLLVNFCAPVLDMAGLPREVLPLMLMRPLSGSASLAMVQELMQTYGPDSRIGLVACTLCASNETLFYVLSVYTAAAGIRKCRHVVPCALFSWLCGSLASGLVWRFF